MLKNVLLLSATLLLFSGCAERGYKLTVNKATGTVTATKSINIRKSTKDTAKTDIDKMQEAVKKEQTRGKPIGRSVDKAENIKKEKAVADKASKAAKEHQLSAQKELAKKEAKRMQLAKEEQSKLAQDEEEKRLLAINEREAKEAHKKEVAKAKRLKEARARETKKALLLTTQGLTFKPSTQTYQKFGTSEIHGHVIYLSSGGVEIFLKNTKIYLVAQNTKMDHWYTNFYLKNSHDSAQTQSIVNYINATKLNLERNFAFYGLAPGNYYVVIESDYPKSMAKNKKVYIAKRITVEKYKKIMTVFSKKL